MKFYFESGVDFTEVDQADFETVREAFDHAKGLAEQTEDPIIVYLWVGTIKPDDGSHR